MDLIDELNKKLGQIPRQFSFLDNLIYLKISKPEHTNKDLDQKLDVLFDNYKDLFENGLIVWGKVVQVNEDLFEKGDENYLGEIVYSFDESINKDPSYLVKVAEELYDLKDSNPKNRSLATIANDLNNDNTCVFGELVPSLISSEYTCRVSTTYFVRKHLHESYLQNGLIPIFVSPGKPYLAMPVPSKYWKMHDLKDQSDRWVTYPVSVEGEQTWISTNISYVESYRSDNLDVCCVIKVKYAESGMPTEEDFEVLNKIDDLLESKLKKMGAIYIGRVTSNGFRSFAYQMQECTQELIMLVTEIAYGFGLEFEVIHRDNDLKSYYLEFLYPQINDWRVIDDMQVLEVLHDANDDPNIEREVVHFSYFKTKEDSQKFKKWLIEAKYSFTSIEQNDKKEYLVEFSHIGTMHLEDISSHSIEINKQCILNKGTYDGWETTVEETPSEPS